LRVVAPPGFKILWILASQIRATSPAMNQTSRRWPDIVKLLEPFARELSYEDRMRLDHARKKLE
jgi:hypothetical protein